MPRPTQGPKAPSTDEIDQMVDFLNDQISRVEERIGDINFANVDTKYEPERKKLESEIPIFERLVEIVDWAGEQVNKRRLYSKKFQLKDKERTRLLKERLGEEYVNVLDQAKKEAAKQLAEEVANEQPDAEDLEYFKQQKD